MIDQWTNKTEKRVGLLPADELSTAAERAKEQLTPRVPSRLARAKSLSYDRRNPEREYLDKKRRNLVRQAISRQHPKFQMILQWCDLDEVSVDQAAHRLRITRAAAKSQLFRARQKLLGTVRGRIGGLR